MSEDESRADESRHKGRHPRRRRILKWTAIVLSVVVLTVAAIGLVLYKKLEGNITAYDPPDLGANQPVKPKVVGPQEPLNVLVLGSDNRDGTKIGGETPGLSDTTILLHLSADRKRAYGVSIPRDAMVQRPDCRSKDGRSTVPGGLTQFNAAYAVGGPGCTIKTVQDITNIKIDHYVVINFAGFKDMVNAINGVKVCVPKEVNDNVGHIHLPAGTYKVTGEQALDYVRVRHDIGVPNGDIGRMKRQQSFIAAMVEKVVSKGTLTNPARLYGFLNAATKSLTTDTGFAHLRELASLGTSLKNIGLDNVQFITVPNEAYAPDPNRLQIAPDAAKLWRKIRLDKPLGRFADDAVTPGRKPGETPSSSASPSPSSSPSSAASPSADASQNQAQKDAANEARRKRAAEEAGLCA